MSRDVEIKIKATDDATSKLERIAMAVEKMATKADVSSSKAGKSANFFSQRIISLNQALSIGRKVLNLFERAMTETIGRSLESRSKFDALNVELTKTNKHIADLAVHIGDALLPSVVGLGVAFDPVVKAMDRWIQQNKELISSGFAETISKVGQVLTVGFALAAESVTKIYTGIRQVGEGIKGLGKYFLEYTLKPIEIWLKVTSKIQEALGMNKLAAGFKAAGAALDGLSDSADANFRAIVTLHAEQESLDQAIVHGATAAYEAFGRVGTEAANRVGAAIKRVVPEIKRNEEAMRAWEEREAEFLAELRDIIGEASGSIQAYIQSNTDYWERQAEMSEAAGRAADEAADTMQQRAEDIGNYIAGVFADLRNEFKTIGDVQSDTVQKIAIVAKKNTDHVYGYVDSISKDQIDALEKVGRTAQVVTETIRIHTKNSADAINAVFERMVDNIINELFRIAAVKIVGLLFDVLGGSGIGSAITSIGTSLTKNINFSHGGTIPRAAGGYMIPDYAGSAGKDSVMIAGMPGERVLTRTETKIYNQTQARGGSGSSTPQVINHKPVNVLAFTTSQAQFRRIYRDEFEPARKKLVKRGIVREG